MGTIAALLLIAAASDVDAAVADRARLPVAEWPYTYYASLSSAAAEDRDTLENAFRFTVASLSRNPRLEEQLPARVTNTLLRLDTRGLAWEHALRQVLVERYPYKPYGLRTHSAPLVFDAAWFVAAVTDPVETGNAQSLLLYGRELKTAAEFRAAWKVVNDPSLNFGLIEGKSGVAFQKTRLLENNASGNRGYSWITYDSRIVAGKTDPLETLTARPPKHDASELIAAIPKTYAGQGGALQAYFLADGKGKAQAKAPADIVIDYRQLRGVEIRNTIGCVQCHAEGIIHPTVDQYKSYILSGARIYADKVTQTEIDRYHASDIAKEIRRANEDYAAGVEMVNGLTPVENAAAFVQIVTQYDAPVSLESAARQAGYPRDQLAFAIADYGRRYGLTGRLALLAQGEEISRHQFIESWPKLQEVIYQWSKQ
jgi:hypothetical protein